MNGASNHGLRSNWPNIFWKGPLTDKKIKKYIEAGYYSPEYREARRALQARKRLKKVAREGNFDKTDDGRLIYHPL